MVRTLINNILKAMFDIIFLSRPILIIPVWGFCCFGYFSGLCHTGTWSLTNGWHLNGVHTFWIIVFSLSVGAVYALNQIVDVKVDTLNGGFALLVKGGVPLWMAWITFGICSLVSIILPILFHPLLAAFSIVALVIGVLYSCKPTYFSGRPIMDFITNATGYGMVSFGAGWIISGGTLSTTCLVASLPYFFMMCAGAISSTLPDYEGDKACGKNTTAVMIGKDAAHLLATGFLVVAFVQSLWLHDWIGLGCSGGSILLYCIYIFHKTTRSMEATYKVGCAIVMLAVCLIYPTFGVVTLITIALTVVYFRIRHRVLYPSLVPVSDE